MKKVRGRVCKRSKRSHPLSILCGLLYICSHFRCLLFIKQQYKNSAGQPFSAAEAAFSVTSQVYYGLRLKSMPRPRPPCRHSFPSICIFWSWPYSTCLYNPVFSSPFIQGHVFFLFSFYFTWSHFSWGADTAYTAFQNEEGKFAFFMSSSSLFLAVQRSACLHFSPLLHCSLPRLFITVHLLVLSSSWS